MNKSFDIYSILCINMSKLLCTCSLALIIFTMATAVYANDSTGYIATGGIEYLKNNTIEMYSENLFISKDEIRVDYQFKNLTKKDVTETILFPLTAIPAEQYGDFADVQGILNSFKIKTNGRIIKPTLNLRILIHPLEHNENGIFTNYEKTIDVTDDFKACSISENEMLPEWVGLNHLSSDSDINQKIIDCNNKTLNQFIYNAEDGAYLSEWSVQLIYSWKQTFKANATTYVEHFYKPLIGFSPHMSQNEYEEFCMDDSVSQAHSYNRGFLYPYEGLSYILTSGANWAKPITHFKLTVKRDTDEFVSFCWHNKQKIKKVALDTFEVIETNFTPRNDLNIAFFKIIKNDDLLDGHGR